MRRIKEILRKVLVRELFPIVCADTYGAYQKTRTCPNCQSKLSQPPKVELKDDKILVYCPKCRRSPKILVWIGKSGELIH